MRAPLLFIIISLILSTQAHANLMCTSLFDKDNFKANIAELETATQNGKPRYYSVRNYSRFKDHELDTYLKSIKNLTQFSEKLSEVSTFVPDRSDIPSEAFFIANQIIPMIESFLKSHDVNFRIETFERGESKRTLIVITEEGSNNLNTLSKLLSERANTSLTIDPIELFYGYEHYNHSRGKFFDIDEFNAAYAMSFYLLLHSQHKNFDFSIAKTDLELHKLNVELQGDMMTQKVEDSLLKIEDEGPQGSQLKYQQEAAANMQKKIDEARKNIENKK